MMNTPILAGYDPRTRDPAPVRLAVSLARITGAPLVVALVEAPEPPLPISAGGSPIMIGPADADLVEDCSDAVAEIEAELHRADVTAECTRLRSTSAARALHEEAERRRAVLLVAGSSRRARPGGLALGSTAERLVSGAPCPVAMAPAGWDADRDPEIVGVGYVDADESRAALRAAHVLARRVGAALRVMTVVKPVLSMRLEADAYRSGQSGKTVEDVEGEHRLAAERHLRAVVEELGDAVPVEIDAVVGDPADELVNLSRFVHLLVCGSRGYGPLRAVLLGSVTRRVVEDGRCPIMVVPRGAQSSLEALIEAGVATPA